MTAAADWSIQMGTVVFFLRRCIERLAMSDGPDADPEVLEAYWDDEQVDVLFADLSVVAEVKRVQVRLRGNGTVSRGQDASVSLEDAHARWRAGEVVAAQIYYTFDHVSWCDTLMPTGSLTRIIRTRLPSNHEM